MGDPVNLKYKISGQINSEEVSEALVEAELNVVCAKYGLDLEVIFDEDD